MNKKGLEAEHLEETPNLEVIANKPLYKDKTQNKRVDINILKARAKALEDKENMKNIIILVFFVLALGVTGIYFSI